MTESDTSQSGAPQDTGEPTSRSLLIPSILILLIGVTVAAAAVVYLLGNDGGSNDEREYALETLDLSAPILVDGDTLREVRIVIDPAKKGENSVDVRFGNTLDPASQENPGVDFVELTATRIDAPGTASTASIAPNEDDEFSGATLAFEENGWWRVDLVLSMSSGERLLLPYYLLIPDPNVNGFSAPPDYDSTDLGTALYERGMSSMTSLSSIYYDERLGSGLGTVAIARRAVSDGTDGNPRTSWLRAPQIQILTIDGVTWQKPQGEDWYERTPVEMLPPTDWGQLYQGATQMREGLTEMIDGRPTQIVTFSIPETEALAAAWYVWWIDIESGNVVREVMISRLHYMVYDFYGFNEPVVAEPPVLESESTPQASPVPVATPA